MGMLSVPTDLFASHIHLKAVWEQWDKFYMTRVNIFSSCVRPNEKHMKTMVTF